jgi:hypothetical protein
MHIIELAQNLYKAQGNVTYSDWPPEIILPKEAFDHFKRLEKYTATEGPLLFEKRLGTFGWEYAITIVCFGKDLYYGKPTAGNNTSVLPVTKISVEQNEYKPNKGEVDFKLGIGDSVTKTKSYKVEYVKNNKEFIYMTLMVIHTHPKYHFDDGSHQYTFFSIPDLKFLASSRTYILGLITKNSLWLVCKTSGFNSINPELLHEVTRVEKLSREEGMKNFISENFRETGLVFYQGSFGSKLQKIQYIKK